MKSTLLWTLALLNAALAGSFVFRLFPANEAHAQAARRAGDYVIIPGELAGGNNAVIYVLDNATGALSALAYDEPRNDIRMMSPIELGRVFEAGAAIGTDRKRR